jgi:hypothetical protein
MAIGLAAGFTEPIEATSVWIQVIMIDRLTSHLSELYKDSQEARDNFNYYFSKINNNILAGLQLHYYVNRNDSPFWKEFRTKNTIVDTIADVIHRNKYIPLEEDSYLNSSMTNIGLPSWLMLMEGQGILNKSFYPRRVEELAALPEDNYNLLLKDGAHDPLIPTNIFTNTISLDWKVNHYPVVHNAATLK